MPRSARIVAPGYPHHVTQRGNYKQPVFLEETDYFYYLRLVEHYRKKLNLPILAYCLMPNHVHYAVVPEAEDSLSKMFHACHMTYAQYFNKKHAKTGHLWQGRFYSCALDDSPLYSVIRYIENNPVRADLKEETENWKWSSVRTRLKMESGIISLSNLDDLLRIKDWKSYILEREDKEIIKNIKDHTLNGKPLGNKKFIQALEKKLDLSLKIRPRGRPLM